MTDSATTPADVGAPSPPEEFASRLRAQGTRYHNLHPFHLRMDAGELSREELQRWVTNRFYYQKCIPLKDAAIMSNCPEVEIVVPHSLKPQLGDEVFPHNSTSSPS